MKSRKIINKILPMSQTSRRVMIGLHLPDYDQVPEYHEENLPPILSHMDPVDIVKQLSSAHVQMFWYYSKCHMGNAYYPSKVGHVHSALNGRDLFGEITEACLSEGITPGCVYEFSDLRIPRDNPEWCHKIIDGNLDENIDLTDAMQGASVSGPCLNGPYGDFVIEQTLEVIKNYPVQAYYVDFLGLFTFGRWLCPYCGEIFKKEFGFEFRGVNNLSHTNYVKYIKWHYYQNERYIRKLRRALKKSRPNIAFTYNFHGNSNAVNLQRPDFTSVNCDFVTGDLFQMRSGMLQLSWKMRQYRALTTKGPGEALLDSTVASGADCQTPKAIDSYRAELWTARSVNVVPCSSVISSITGEIEKEKIELIKELNNEQIKYDEYFQDMVPLAAVGILRSHNSYECRPKQINSAVSTPHHCLEFEGWCQFLIESHQLWDVISDHQLTLDYLSKFHILLLPDTCCMSDKQCEAVKLFVRNGGCLIATGETSLFNENGKEHENFSLSPVLGVNFKNYTNAEFNQLKIDESIFIKQKPWQTNILFFNDGQLAVEAHPGAKVKGEIFKKTKINLCNAMIPAGYPGLIVNQYGKGNVFYFAGKAGMQYRIWGQYSVKRVIENILMQEVGDKSLVKVEAPDTVELFVHCQEKQKRIIISMVNAVSGVSRSAGNVYLKEGYIQSDLIRFDEVEAMPSTGTIIVRLNIKKNLIKKIILMPDKKELSLKTNNNGIFIKIPAFKVYSMIIIEKEK